MQHGDAEHYRQIAENVRHEAEAVKDVGLKLQFLEIAMRYDKLADSIAHLDAVRAEVEAEVPVPESEPDAAW